MKTKKVKTRLKLMIAVISGISIFLITATACSGTLNAQPSEETGIMQESMIEKFAQRFGLDEEEIYEFFEEIRDERKALADERLKERLDELVEEGQITEAQKDAIIAKLGELKEFKSSLEDMKVSEARQAIKEMREDLKDWAEENDIDLKPFFANNGPEGKRAKINGHFRSIFGW
ncbi:MAG: hypothetical protein JW997_05055 [Actinobacteria bacterium]|nr:hypothetical protein [Actinomycetota bacterium]